MTKEMRDLEPAELIQRSRPLQPPEGGRGGAAEAVADRVVEEQQRDAGGEQRTQVRDEEGAAAVLVGDVREAPDVAEPDGGSDRGEDEADLTGPLLPGLRSPKAGACSSRRSSRSPRVRSRQCDARRYAERYQPDRDHRARRTGILPSHHTLHPGVDHTPVDVVVIGAGQAGLSAAYHLRGAGSCRSIARSATPRRSSCSTRMTRRAARGSTAGRRCGWRRSTASTSCRASRCRLPIRGRRAATSYRRTFAPTRTVRPRRAAPGAGRRGAPRGRRAARSTARRDGCRRLGGPLRHQRDRHLDAPLLAALPGQDVPRAPAARRGTTSRPTSSPAVAS